MNLRDIAEIAVLTTWHRQTESLAKIPDERLACYIRYTRLRTHVWHLCIEQLKATPDPDSYTQLFQEVLISEFLAEVVRHTVLRGEYTIGQRMTESVISIRRILEKERKSIPSFAQALKLERLQRRLEQWLAVLKKDRLKSDADYAVAMASIRIATPDSQITDERRAAVQRAVQNSILDLISWSRKNPRQDQLLEMIRAGSTCN